MKNVLYYSLDINVDYDFFKSKQHYFSISEQFEEILCKVYQNDNGLKGLVEDTKDYISPYICFAYKGLIEGYKEEEHKKAFLKTNKDDKIMFALYSNSETSKEIDTKNFKSLLYPSLDKNGYWNGFVNGFYYIKLNQEFILDKNIIKNDKETNVFFYADIMKNAEINFIKESPRIVILKNGIKL